MKIPFGKPLIDDSEKKAVMDVLSSPILVHGSKAIKFENEFANFTKAPYSVSLSSCTAGLHLVYFSRGIGVGDEVIVPAMTHIATAHAVELTGATPVFIDAESETGNINIDSIEAAITDKTKAISIVHFLGMPVDMDMINVIAKKHNLLVIEDSALALGSTLDGIHTGLLGDVGVFSFYPVKHITSAEGGMLITKNKELADDVKLKKAFGVDKTHGERAVPGLYDTVALGLNYRMSEVHAAIGLEQLKKLPGFLKKREENYKKLENELHEISEINLLKSTHDKFKSSYYCLSFILRKSLLEKRYEIMNELKENGVGSSIYYPQPVPRMTYYREKYGYVSGQYHNAEIISDQSIALPVGPHLDENDMVTISDVLKKTIKKIK
jgi:perosamine synthetase